MKKSVIVGIDDFKYLIESNGYYVDKTKFIESILTDRSVSKLLIRPRRFGKTLNMSTLKYFLDIEDREENRKLFKGTYIENTSIFSEQGQHPVIFISMKDVHGNTLVDLENSLRNHIAILYRTFIHVKESLHNIEKKEFDDICSSEKSVDISTALLKLSMYVRRYYNKKPYILIDEYDAPLLSAYEGDYYDSALTIIKSMYGSVLKGNQNINMGIMTGTLRVAQAGIFSDLNNLVVNTILSESYDEDFGFTEEEVVNTIKYFDIEEQIDDIKEWYDGYKFGNIEVYNPWSIINLIYHKKIGSYWINTSGNLLIKNLILQSDSDVYEDLLNLIKGEARAIIIKESLAYGSNLQASNLWELMLFAGYLTVSDKINSELYTVKIPNNEVKTFFRSIFVETMFTSRNLETKDLFNALIGGKVTNILDCFKKILLNITSYNDLDDRYENSYHMLFMGILYAFSDIYTVYSNIETGYGRADLILKSKIKYYPSYIFEFKKGSSYNLKEEAMKAYEQINDKKYETILIKEEVSKVVKVGIAFNKKYLEGFF